MQFNYRLAHAANIWAANNICGESQDILVELGSHVLQGYYCDLAPTILQSNLLLWTL